MIFMFPETEMSDDNRCFFCGKKDMCPSMKALTDLRERVRSNGHTDAPKILKELIFDIRKNILLDCEKNKELNALVDAVEKEFSS